MLHVASPFPIVADESIVQIAVNGTLNVLKACAKSPTVRKVVLTSSCAAINGDQGAQTHIQIHTEHIEIGRELIIFMEIWIIINLGDNCFQFVEGHDDENKVFNEDHWTDTENKRVLAYSRSKTEAERAAWDFVRNFGGIIGGGAMSKEVVLCLWLVFVDGDNKFALTCLNPTLVVGPILIDTQGTSITVWATGLRCPNLLELIALLLR